MAAVDTLMGGHTGPALSLWVQVCDPANKGWCHVDCVKSGVTPLHTLMSGLRTLS